MFVNLPHFAIVSMIFCNFQRLSAYHKYPAATVAMENDPLVAVSTSRHNIDRGSCLMTPEGKVATVFPLNPPSPSPPIRVSMSAGRWYGPQALDWRPQRKLPSVDQTWQAGKSSINLVFQWEIPLEIHGDSKFCNGNTSYVLLGDFQVLAMFDCQSATKMDTSTFPATPTMDPAPVGLTCGKLRV